MSAEVWRAPSSQRSVWLHERMHLWRIVEERHRWVGGRGVDEGGIGRTDGDGRTAERLELASSRLAALEYLDAALVGRDNEHRGATPGDLQLLEESTFDLGARREGHCDARRSAQTQRRATQRHCRMAGQEEARASPHRHRRLRTASSNAPVTPPREKANYRYHGTMYRYYLRVLLLLPPSLAAPTAK